MFIKRTYTCGELRAADEGKQVVLNGWVDSIRDHGGVLFADIRDRYGKTQVVFKTSDIRLKPESVIAVRGKVVKRTKETINSKIPTGEIEVAEEEVQIINEAKALPFPIADDVKVDMELRLKYRPLDLRRPQMQKNLIIRGKIAKIMRDYFTSNNFIEIETPYMIKYTPGGARNFLVPSRLFASHFFALAESPQIFKQLYMLSCFDRYFQIAKCFRDEDPRADRQFEFTQLDLEMSFVEPEDVMNIVEGCICTIFEQVSGIKFDRPFLRIPYDHAMLHYGIDKPDLRFDLKINDITDIVKASGSTIIQDALKSGSFIRAFSCPQSFSRKQIDELTEFCKKEGAKGLFTVKTGAQSKFFNPVELEEIVKRTMAKPEDTLFIVADKKASEILGALRLHLGDLLGLKDKTKFVPCWVTDFPMFEQNENGEILARHHPFTSPQDDHLSFLESNPMAVQAKAYDLVMNGTELGGGSIRIHKSDVQNRVFKMLGLSETEIHEKFSFLLEAFQYGAPPHGGIALGFDRLCAIILGHDSIREVIAFPKSHTGQDLFTNAPTKVGDKQLKELHIKVIEDEKK